MTQPETHPRPLISLIAAMSENRVIGRDNQLPWRMPTDMAFFKNKTTGHPVIMGRKNFESSGRPLPNRRNIVLTRNPDFHHPGIEVAHSLLAALDLARTSESDEIFIIGGQQIYQLALPLAHRIYLTIIHAQIPGDTFFPNFNPSCWKLAARDDHSADDKNPHPFSFLQYNRS